MAEFVPYQEYLDTAITSLAASMPSLRFSVEVPGDADPDELIAWATENCDGWFTYVTHPTEGFRFTFSDQQAAALFKTFHG